MGFLLLIELRDFTLAHYHATHAGSDNDPDAVGILLLHLKA